MSTRIPREKAVFVEALEIADPEQRRQFLDQACGADHALREQVERLLALSQGAGDFFKDCAPALEPAVADAAQVLSAAESALEPELLLPLLLCLAALQAVFALRIALMAVLAPQSTTFQRSEAWRLLSEKRSESGISGATISRCRSRRVPGRNRRWGC